MKSAGVNANFIQESQEEFTGRATIQVCQKTSENAIILSSNTNYTINLEVAEEEINNLFGEGDWLVLQNEVLGNEKVVEVAKAKGNL
jgi:sugar/nucleoside kinase (ribokinase family)